ncbi:transposase [Streptomyces sp. NPDC014622]|uniref:transposase n=1 Tax=Streptomyces sp. NPDC014622 TaxID=3364874 RepID=UPI0036FBE719
MTDAEREFLGPYLPIGRYGPFPERLRRQFEGVVWWFRTGCQWREMPQEFGAWSTVHHRFRQCKQQALAAEADHGRSHVRITAALTVPWKTWARMS